MAQIPAALLQGSGVIRPDDVAVNLLIYLPFGFLIALASAAYLSPGLRCVVMSGALGWIVSLTAEIGQMALPERVASGLDVGLNAFGAGLGGWFGLILVRFGDRWLCTARAAFARSPFRFLTALLIFGLFLCELAPFTFVTTTSELHESFRRAWEFMVSSPDGGASLSFLADQLGDVIWFGVLGYVMALAERERGRPRDQALMATVKHAVVLASVIEIVQVFTPLHVPELFAIPWRLVGAAFAAWCVLFVIDDNRSLWRTHPGLAFPTLLMIALISVQLAVIALSVLGTSATTLESVASHWPRCLPLESAWRRPFGAVVAEAVEAAVTFGALATAVGVALRRTGVPGAWPLAGWLVVMLAGTVEASRAMMSGKEMDLTVPLAAGAACVLVARIQTSLFGEWEIDAAFAEGDG